MLLIADFGHSRWHSGKEFPCQPASPGDMGLIPGSERSPGGGNGNPLQYSCLGNPTDRGAWWVAVHRAAKNQMQLTTHIYSGTRLCIKSFTCVISFNSNNLSKVQQKSLLLLLSLNRYLTTSILMYSIEEIPPEDNSLFFKWLNMHAH